jgi:hypothetical protein
VANWTAALQPAERASIERHLRCLSCREVNAPLDASLFEPQAHDANNS